LPNVFVTISAKIIVPELMGFLVKRLAAAIANHARIVAGAQRKAPLPNPLDFCSPAIREASFVNYLVQKTESNQTKRERMQTK